MSDDPAPPGARSDSRASEPRRVPRSAGHAGLEAWNTGRVPPADQRIPRTASNAGGVEPFETKRSIARCASHVPPRGLRKGTVTAAVTATQSAWSLRSSRQPRRSQPPAPQEIERKRSGHIAAVATATRSRAPGPTAREAAPPSTRQRRRVPPRQSADADQTPAGARYPDRDVAANGPERDEGGSTAQRATGGQRGEAVVGDRSYRDDADVNTSRTSCRDPSARRIRRRDRLDSGAPAREQRGRRRAGPPRLRRVEGRGCQSRRPA